MKAGVLLRQWSRKDRATQQAGQTILFSGQGMEAYLAVTEAGRASRSCDRRKNILCRRRIQAATSRPLWSLWASLSRTSTHAALGTQLSGVAKIASAQFGQLRCAECLQKCVQREDTPQIDSTRDPATFRAVDRCFLPEPTVSIELNGYVLEKRDPTQAGLLQESPHPPARYLFCNAYLLQQRLGLMVGQSSSSTTYGMDDTHSCRGKSPESPGNHRRGPGLGSEERSIV